MSERVSPAPKGKKLKVPSRQPDFISKRGVKYWWSPEWTRQLGSGTTGRIKPIRSKNNDEVADLYMVSKDGNCSYIQGSIQEDFQEWHEENGIDLLMYIIHGIEEEDPLETKWEYE